MTSDRRKLNTAGYLSAPISKGSICNIRKRLIGRSVIKSGPLKTVNGILVWYLLAKDEGHGFSKKSNADFQFYAIVLFIKEYLLN